MEIHLVPQTASFTSFYWCLVFFYFSVFWCSVVGFGNFFLQQGIKALGVNVESFSLRLALCLYLGSVFYSLFWSWVPPQAVGMGCLAVGLFLFLKTCREGGFEFSILPRKLKAHWFWFSVLAAFFLIRFLPSLKINTHGDVFGYHLLAPKLWQLLGKVEFIPGLPALFCASFWEYFLGWAHLIFPSTHVNALIAAQIFGQWQSYFIAYFGAALWVWGISGDGLRSKFISAEWQTGPGKNKQNQILGWQVIITLGVMSIRPVRDFGTLAKNDWGSLFWALIPITLFFRILFNSSAKSISYFVLGCALGFVASAKFTLIPSLVGVGGVGLVALLFTSQSGEEKGRGAGALLLGGIMGIFPILLRNGMATGNPFFPAMGAWFYSPYLSESYREIMRPVEASTAAAAFGSFRYELPRLGALYLVTLGMGFLLMLKRYRNYFSLFFLAGMIGLVLYVFKGVYEIRYVALSLLLVVWLGFLSLATYCGKWKAMGRPALVSIEKKIGMSILQLAVLIGVLAESGLPIHLLSKIGTGAWPSANQVVDQEILSAPVLQWVRQNIPTGTKVLSSHIELYYVSHLKPAQPQLDPRIDASLRALPPGAEFTFVKGLVNEGYHYYLDMRFGYGSDFTFLPVVEKLLAGYKKRHVDSINASSPSLERVIPFTEVGGNSRVIDLRQLVEGLE